MDMKQTGLKTGMILNIMTDGSSFQVFRQIKCMEQGYI